MWIGEFSGSRGRYLSSLRLTAIAPPSPPPHSGVFPRCWRSRMACLLWSCTNYPQGRWPGDRRPRWSCVTRDPTGTFSRDRLFLPEQGCGYELGWSCRLPGRRSEGNGRSPGRSGHWCREEGGCRGRVTKGITTSQSLRRAGGY